MAKDKRTYNVFFNVHTVSGIVISIGLFVIFLAGAFALFRSEINAWQYNVPHRAVKMDIDYERVLALVEAEGYAVEGRSINIRYSPTAHYVQAFSQAMELDSTEAAGIQGNTERIRMRFDPDTYAVLDEAQNRSGFLGTYIYQLHYFRQIPVVGVYISGFIALFFAFAVISGVVVHWRKIATNFFTFRIKSSLKNLWTDAHVALGILGLPLQFMYAVTGAYLGISGLVYLPILFLQFQGDFDKIAEAVNPPANHLELPAPEANAMALGINTWVHTEVATLDPEEIRSQSITIDHYQQPEAHVTLSTTYKGQSEFFTRAHKTIRLVDGFLIEEENQGEGNAFNTTQETLINLHYARYGGVFMKIVYFVLALITCFVIISGVMVWLVAR
ncbi:MAG: PepSY-associated TM helix domain-containing protein, partial [Bacteroidota bacterium]